MNRPIFLVKTFCASAVLLCVCIYSAQQTDLNAYLATWESDYLVINQKNEVNLLAAGRVSSLMFDKLEIKIDTADLGLPGQKYSARLVFNGIGEGINSSRKYATDLAYSTQIYRIKRSAVLRERFIDYINFTYNARLLEMKTRLRTVYEDKVSVYKSMVENVGSSIDLLLAAEDEHTDVEMDVIDLTSDLETLRLRISAVSGNADFISFSSNEWISINEVSARLMKAYLPQSNNLFIRRAELDLERARNDWNLEKSKLNRYLTYAQASYDTSRWYMPKQSVSVETGFSIPLDSTRRYRNRGRKLEITAEENRLAEVKHEIYLSLTALSNETAKLLAQYSILENKKDRGNAAASFQMTKSRMGSDPLSMLRAAEKMLRLQISQTKFERDIYQRYIKLLYFTGTLQPDQRLLIIPASPEK